MDVAADGAPVIHIRPARRDDVPSVVDLLTDDFLGSSRENSDGSLDAYYAAYEAIDADPNGLLWVVEDESANIAGTLQLTFIPGLSHRGAWRAQIEAVRVAAGQRGARIGERMIAAAIDEARQRGCSIVQLTTDLRRERAHHFYERLGFNHTHAGYKLTLTP